ncbi:carboxypeptidase-like regulatory domain-containing protein [Rhodocaloribacter sp.]
MRLRTFLLFAIFLLLLPALSAEAQRADVVLTGYVRDAETGAPLPGANVFVAGTMLGASTDAEGFFSITGLPLGTLEVVASFLGYDAVTERMRFDEGGTRERTFRLTPRVIESEGIEVTALSEKTWKKHFDRFRKFFLGVSRNASKCEILNPEVLDFEVGEDEDERFVVRAREPLMIENRALGYLLQFVLDEFELRERRHYVKYSGRVGFTEMTPAGEKERKKWEKRRREAYNGSLRHFLTALVRDRLWDEGFMLLSEEKSQESVYAGVPGNRPATRVNGVKPHEVLEAAELPFERRLSFPGYLKVIYFNEQPSAQYLKFREYAARRIRTSEDEQVSYIALNQPDVLITTDGLVEDTYALTKFGYWYFERVAELLPMEYHPDGWGRVRGQVAGVPGMNLERALRKGASAAKEERFEEAVRRLQLVVATDPGFYLDDVGSAAYWLGVAHEALGHMAAAHEAWRSGLDGLAGKQKLELRLADTFVRSVFDHQDQTSYEKASFAYLAILERAGESLSEADAAIVRRHVAQMLPILTDEERERVIEGRPGPLLQGLRLRSGAGDFLSTWWRRQDPLPASALNERVAEHLSRVAYSVKNFAFDGSPDGFDDRGKAYVRYGPPYSKNSILVDVSRATQILRENAYPMPGTLISPMNEFWTYRHVDDLIHYVFVLKGGRYQEASPEDLVPDDLMNAHKRRGVGHTDPATMSNPGGIQAPANQVMAEALYELRKGLYAQLALYHPVYEKQVEELEYQESDIRATKFGDNRSVSASALSFVYSAEAKFDLLAREAVQRREDEAPRAFSRITDALEKLPVESRIARFLEEDGSTRTEVYWSHVPGSLTLSKKQRKRTLPSGAPPPDQYLIEMVVNLNSEDYRRRVPTTLRYLASDLPRGAPAPVQMVEVTGSTTPYHLAMQWDEYLAEGAGDDVSRGAYLRTGVQRYDNLEPLNPDPFTLEMSDLKPVYIEEEGSIVRLLNADDPSASVPFPFTTLRPDMALGLEFEVYHLAFGSDDRVHYTVEYEVVIDPERRGEKRTSAHTAYTGASTTAKEFIGVDLRSIDEGPLRITVRVIDEVNRRTVERSLDFTLER